MDEPSGPEEQDLHSVFCGHQFEHLTFSLPTVVFSNLAFFPSNDFFLKLLV